MPVVSLLWFYLNDVIILVVQYIDCLLMNVTMWI